MRGACWDVETGHLSPWPDQQDVPSLGLRPGHRVEGARGLS